MAPSSIFLTFSWEISHNIIILRFCNIVEGQANWLNLTEFKIESKISLLRKILRNILRFGKFFCYKSPNHVQNIWLTTLFGENYDSTEFMLGLITRAEHCARFNTLFSFRLLGLIQNNKAICRYLLCFSAFECIFVDWL